MRTIGRIVIKQNKEGFVENHEYADGIIVELTSQEAMLLRGLQDSCDGQRWNLERILNDPHNSKPNDVDMSEAFGLVRRFAEMRFAVNDFKSMVNQLEDTINGLDKTNE